MTRNPAARRYLRRFIPLMLAYVATVVGVGMWFDDGGPAGWLRYPVAALPAIPIVGVIYVMGRFIVEQRDEYQRMVMVRQVLAATGFTLAVTTVWGFLEGPGLVPHVPAYATFMIFCAALLPSSLGNAWRG